MCVRVTALLVFIIAVHLGNQVFFYQLSPLTMQVTETILSPSVPETVKIREIDLINVAKAGANS